MKPFAYLCIILLGLFVLESEPDFTSETNWEVSTETGCFLSAKSQGVELSILYAPPIHSLSVARPSKLNDFIHSSINWPKPSEFSVDPDEEDIFAIFFASNPKKIKLQMAHEGGGDNDIGSFERSDVVRFASTLAREHNVEIFTHKSTFAGSEITRLGRWVAKSKLDRDKLNDFNVCIKSI